LLISGAVLFALFRLVAVSDEAFFRLLVNVGGSLRMATVIGFEYSKLILYTLIAAFVAHLGARAWWIALIGIDAAFPQGPRWDNLRYGPATLEAYRESMRPLRQRIAAADLFASVVFSTGLAFALLFTLSVVGCAVFGAVAWALAAIVPGLGFDRAFLLAAGTVVVLLLIVGVVDKLYGRRLLDRPRTARPLRVAARLATRVTGVGVYAPITFAVTSHLPKRRVSAAFTAALFLVLGLFVVRDVLVGLDLASLHSHRFLPDQSGGAGLDPDYYEAYREPYGLAWTLPSLPTEVLVGPYARLFVPFSPDRVDRGMKLRCPDLAPARQAGLGFEGRPGIAAAEEARAATAVRDCLAGLVAVELDGKALPPTSLLVGVHPRSGARGLVAYVALTGLGPGRHQIVVRDLPLPGEDRKPRTHVLPFWR
jgi:hypothetical protein